MITPPFTVLILKSTHHPLTIRITFGMMVIGVTALLVAGAVIGLTAGLVFRGPGVEKVLFTGDESKETLINTPGKTVVESETSDVTDLILTRPDQDSAELTVAFTDEPSNEVVYLWLVVNPDTDTPGDLVIYPRNPLFRGFPVDYRNGVELFPSRGKEAKVTMSKLTAGIRADRFRILIYSATGDILVNRYFTEKTKT